MLKTANYWVNVVITILTKWARFNTIPSENPTGFIAEGGKLIINLYGNTKDPEQSKQFWKV